MNDHTSKLGIDLCKQDAIPFGRTAAHTTENCSDNQQRDEYTETDRNDQPVRYIVVMMW